MTCSGTNEPLGPVPEHETPRCLLQTAELGLTFIGSHWSARDTRYPSDRWGTWVKRATDAGGAVTLDMGPNWDPKVGPIGSLAEAQVEQLKAVKAAVRGIGAAPSMQNDHPVPGQ